MVETYVQLPTDATNTGKKVRTNERIVGANTVEEHYMILQDKTNDYQAQVTSAGALAVSGNVLSTGSVAITTPVLGVSGTTFQNMAGSVFFGGGTGSVTISGTAQVVGSVSISTNVLGVSGAYFPGSMWFGGGVGSVMLSGIAQMSGSVAISTNVLGVSGAYFPGSFYFAGGVGSVMISGISQIAGSVAISTNVLGVSGAYFPGSFYFAGGVGSVMLSGTSQVAGSVAISTNVLGVSGTLFQNMLGSFALTNIGSFYFAGGVGSVMISGLSQISGSVAITTNVLGVSGTYFPGSIWFGGVGSVVVSNMPAIGSYTGMSNGSIFWGGGVGSMVISGVQPAWTGVGSILTIGIGSVYIVATNSDAAWEDLGSPCFKSSTLIASGGYSDTWAIGGTGSRLEVHGWHISTNLAGIVRLLISGTTNVTDSSPGLISQYYLNFASGGTVEKTFAFPIVPAGAGSNIGFGTTCAGSTNVTIFGREIK